MTGKFFVMSLEQLRYNARQTSVIRKSWKCREAVLVMKERVITQEWGIIWETSLIQEWLRIETEAVFIHTSIMKESVISQGKW